MTNPILYVFLNKSLHMTVGKAAAQAVHAAMMANATIITDEQRYDWSNATHKTVIILEAENEPKIKNISSYLFERGIRTYYVIDEGVNEIDPHTITAMSTPILDKDDERTKAALSTFSTYREIARFKVEFER